MKVEQDLIKKFCDKLNLDKKVNQLADQFYQQLQSAFKGRTPHPQLTHPQVKMCICIELSCRHYRYQIQKSLLLKLAGITQKQYKTCFSVVEALLKLKENSTIQQLAIQFSCVNYTEKAVQVHEFYSQKQNLRQKEMGHDPIDFSLHVYKCAALVVASKLKKGRMNQKQFCSTFSFTMAQLDKIVKDMLQFTDEMEVELEQQKMTFAQNVEALANAMEDEKEKEEKKEDLLWQYYPGGPLLSVYNEKYLAWRAKMIELAKS